MLLHPLSAHTSKLFFSSSYLISSKTGFSAVSLYASTKYVRAWPGGTGDAKIGGNYAPGILPQIEVAKDGFQQILWLFGPDLNITEGKRVYILIS